MRLSQYQYVKVTWSTIPHISASSPVSIWVWKDLFDKRNQSWSFIQGRASLILNAPLPPPKKKTSNNLCSSSFIWRVLIWSCSFSWESLICNFHQNLVIFNLFQPDLHFNKTSTWLACFSDSSCLLRSASASSLLQYKQFCDFARNKKKKDD